jgi:type IV secretory pathway protease TraF
MVEALLNASQSPQFPPIFDVDGLIVRIEQTIKSALKQPILPDAVYSYDELVQVTGFSLSTIIRADRKGRLAGRYEGRRRYFIGRDVLTWLTAKEGGENQ